MAASVLARKPPAPSSNSVARRRWLLVASLVVANCAVVWVHSVSGDSEASRWWVVAVFPMAAALAALACFRTMARLTGPLRRTWLFVGLGCLGSGTADIVWAQSGFFLGNANTNAIDVLYTSFPSAARSPFTAVPVRKSTRPDPKTEFRSTHSSVVRRLAIITISSSLGSGSPASGPEGLLATILSSVAPAASRRSSTSGWSSRSRFRRRASMAWE